MLELNEENIDQFVSQMSLREKVGQLNQHLYGWQVFHKNQDGTYELTQLFKDHIQRFGGVGAIYGILRADSWSGMNELNGIAKEDSARVIQMVQDYIQQNTRLKIPALISEECVHGHQALHSMMYPSNISMGMTWNPKLVESICQEVSDELSDKGGHLALYTGLDVMRDPRWGRTEECYSEDAYLSSVMVRHAVNGFQYDKDNGVGVILKHMCAQGAATGGHNSGAASIGPRELREVFLPPVESGIRANAKGVMAAYNEIDGIPCHANSYLINSILRNEYDFKGIVMADGCALDRLLMMQPNVAKAAAMANQAGVDISLWDDVYTHLEQSVTEGYLNEEILDKSVKRVLKLKIELGLFEKRKPKKRISRAFEKSLQAARECQVLLKNNNILPLNDSYKKIAVIGPNANNPLNMLGDYTSFQKEEDMITLYQGIKKIVKDDVEVKFALGCKVRDMDFQYMEEAIQLAKDSDIAIVALGGSSVRNFKAEFESNGAVKTSYDKDEMNCGENVDMACLNLEGRQVELLHEIKKVNEKVIVVLIQGRPHTISNIVEDSDAILCAWYPGNLGGLAIAETLYGINNPSGRLSMSIPLSSMQLPCYYNGKYSGAKIDYSDMSGRPLYNFGYGLSYTRYVYENIFLSENEITVEQLLEKGMDVDLDITNIGEFDGQEVVQIYLIDQESSITRRVKELKGFKKIFVASGETKHVNIHLDADAFKIWDCEMKYVVEKGNVDILVARNADDYVKKTLKII